MKNTNIRILIRNIIIELIVYGMLLVIYFFAVLQFLGEILINLFESEAVVVYSILGLGLIIAQAVLLETITSYLIRLLRLDRIV